MINSKAGKLRSTYCVYLAKRPARSPISTSHRAAGAPQRWHFPACRAKALAMAEPISTRPPPQGGGCLIAAGLVLGPLAGMAVGQTSLGLVIGAAIGIAAAVLMAVRDRRR